MFYRAHTFFLSHCVGNASGTNEAIQLAERRTIPSTTASTLPSTLNVPVTSAPIDSTRSSSIQPTINLNNNEINTKKSIQLEQQTSIFAKRTSDSFMTTTTTMNDEQNRRRSSLSTELNVSDRSNRKASNPSTTVNSNSSTQINKSMITNLTSNEKVVIIDTTAVSFIYTQLSN